MRKYPVCRCFTGHLGVQPNFRHMTHSNLKFVVLCSSISQRYPMNSHDIPIFVAKTIHFMSHSLKHVHSLTSFFRNWATVQVLSRSGATSNFIRKRCGCAHPIFFEFPAMWVKQYHVYHPPVITIFIGGMWLPFPVMGGLWLFYPHYTYIGFI